MVWYGFFSLSNIEKKIVFIDISQLIPLLSPGLPRELNTCNFSCQRTHIFDGLQPIVDYSTIWPSKPEVASQTNVSNSVVLLAIDSIQLC